MRKSTAFFLFKQGLREVFSLWKQFLAIVAIGAIAVTLFVGLQANADSLEQRVNDIYRAGNIADSFVTVNPMKGNQPDFDSIKKIVGEEAEVEGRFYAYTRLNGYNAYCAISSDFPTISKPSFLIDSIEGEEEVDFFIVDRLLSSDDPEDGNSSKAVIGEPSQIEFDLTAYVSGGLLDDDMIDSLGFEDYLRDGMRIDDTPLKKALITLEIPVTGRMDHPENIARSTYSMSVFLLSSHSFAKAFDAYLSQFFTKEGVDLFYAALQFSPLAWNRQRENRFPIPNQFLIKGKDGFDVNKANEAISAYFESKSEEDQNLLMLQKRSDTSFASVMDNDVLQARQLTFVFPFVFFAVAILVILTTMSQLILKERTQIGTLKAMGLSRRGITLYYISITLIVVGVGLLIGEILGPIIIPHILDFKYTVLYNLPKTSYVFPVLPGILTAATFLSLSALVTFLTVRKEAKLLPAESMRPPVKVYKGIGERRATSSKSKFRFSFLMAMRNIRGNLVKSIMVILGILGCTALLCCGFGIDDTIDYGIGHDPLILNHSDMSLTLTSEMKKEKVMADLQGILQNGEVLDIEGCSRNNSEIRYNDKSVNSYYNVYAPLEEKEAVENLLPFSWNQDEVMLSKKMAGRIGATIGDTISFTLGNQTYEARVGEIVDIFYSNGVYLYSNAPFLKEEISSFSSYYIDLRDGDDIEGIKKAIEDGISYVGAVTTPSRVRASLNDAVASIASITTAVKVFAILLAIVVLYNISVLNFTERSRDIATMKVLGFNRIEIAGSLLSETLTLTFIGVVLGLFVGLPFLTLVLYINQVEVISYIITIYPFSYVLAFLLTFAVSSLINTYLSNRTKKVKMVESLKSVE